jgi:hypothetical protein
MDLFFIALVLLFAIFGSVGSPFRRSLWYSSWLGYDDWSDGWGWSRNRKPLKTDWEVRQESPHIPHEDVVTVHASDDIENPDRGLEALIADEKFNEARQYRRDMEKIADDMNDDGCLRKYAIYGARIAKAEKEYRERLTREDQASRDWRSFKKSEEDDRIGEGLASPPHDSKASSATPPIWKKALHTVEAGAGFRPLEFQPGKITIPDPTLDGPDSRMEFGFPPTPKVPEEAKKEPPALPPPVERIGPEYIPPPPPTPPPPYERPAPVESAPEQIPAPPVEEKEEPEEKLEIDVEDYKDLIDI